MALTFKDMARTFVFKMEDSKKTIGLPDPNVRLSPDEVKRFYQTQYPELVRATIGGPEILEGKARYTFTSKADEHG